jgi:hypothetical protein
VRYGFVKENMVNKINNKRFAFNERNPHTTKQQGPVVRSMGGPQTKPGQGTRQSTDMIITK